MFETVALCQIFNSQCFCKCQIKQYLLKKKAFTAIRQINFYFTRFLTDAISYVYNISYRRDVYSSKIFILPDFTKLLLFLYFHDNDVVSVIGALAFWKRWFFFLNTGYYLFTIWLFLAVFSYFLQQTEEITRCCHNFQVHSHINVLRITKIKQTETKFWWDIIIYIYYLYN